MEGREGAALPSPWRRDETLGAFLHDHTGEVGCLEVAVKSIMPGHD
jgi:hypothetical protein